MQRQLIIGLTLATLATGFVIAPTQQASAINFPNFQPGIQADSNTVKVIIPKDMLEAGLSQTLRINEQRLKDTAFNRFTLKDTSARIRGDQLQVSGVVKVEHRELIASVFGKKKYTPWVSASGRITQNFGVQIRDNKTIVSPKGDPKIEGLEARWYAELVSLAGKFVGPQLAPTVRQAVSNINGVDVRQFAINKSSTSLASKLGLNEGQVRDVLNQYVGTINAGINSGGELVIEYILPNDQLTALKK
jgi:hypothetical protein